MEENIILSESHSEKAAGNLQNKFFFDALKTVFREPLFLILAASSVLNILFFEYFIFSRVTTLTVFFQSNNLLYDWLYIVLTVLAAFAFGVALSFLTWQWQRQRTSNHSSLGNGIIGSFLGVISMGCPVCGAFLLSFIGVAGGLFVFPFQGLEIKAVALGLLSFAALSSAKSISDSTKGVCVSNGNNILKIEDNKLIFSFNRKTIKPVLPLIIGFVLLFLVAITPFLAEKTNLGFKFQKKETAVNPVNAVTGEGEDITQINPSEGYTINAVYGDAGPKLLQSGVINLEAMKALYEQAGAKMTDEQLKMLTEGSNEKVKITPQNSYFLLNFFWAFGLANKNPILDEGPMMKYGQGKIGGFASTGGWTLGTKDATQLYSKYEIVELTPEQQKILEDFAFNSYRPCCSNPTAFPDCNHGMAALGFAELMASQGAKADEIFEAFKYFNAFWFPQTYFDIANYFKAKEGKSWSQVSGRTIAGKDYSTPQGWERVRSWLKSKNLLKEPPSGGGGCGV